MTYGEIYKKFCETIKNVDIEDYRPDELMYTKDIKALEGAGIRIWLKNGDSIIYYPSEVISGRKKPSLSAIDLHSKLIGSDAFID